MPRLAYEALTFDDVLLLPAYSEIVARDVNMQTKLTNKIQLNIALNYGSKEEIVKSIKKLNNLSKPINEKNISKYLYTKNIPDPEILIRTGNRKRLSNFLLWQLSYTEIYFVSKLWPDFTINDFSKIISNFVHVKRNFGGIK